MATSLWLLLKSSQVTNSWANISDDFVSKFIHIKPRSPKAYSLRLKNIAIVGLGTETNVAEKL
jgi:hypothetical protein